MHTWLKILLAVLVVLLVGVVIAGIRFAIWFSNLEESPQQRTVRLAEGAQFAATRTLTDCLREASSRLHTCGAREDATCSARAYDFMEGCTSAVKLSTTDCASVPRRDEVLRTMNWSYDVCKKQFGFSRVSTVCQNLTGYLQDRCNPPAK